MHVILTHEQADFDAVGSQLGAWLLDQGALPVVPIRVNRNVRAFLTLYGTELPFVERQDLPGRRVESALLVDTQSLVTVKGMHPDIPVSVIDHHALREGLPEEWQVQVEEVGANTTIFVEHLRERALPLNQVQATLLLLGIYEDTGSLTYTRTRARDMHAAAYLVECGGSLQIVADFLNHPLSLAQQEILERLKETIEVLDISGNTVILARADASDSHEELSTIAHKMRDEMDPDALLLLIRIPGGIQMIGRSTTDRVDVGALAERFGGGGHTRAAAALIKEQELAGVYDAVIDSLPGFVQPVLTVSQIMSRGGPQVLSPDTPVKEALEKMQRYGYEGYPVVADGRVIGLLTRRAVDRAIGHRLDVSASTVMEAGEVTIRPEAPIEDLQNLMTETGWGQIPVVDPASGRITGIVTRTDLLKTLSPQPAIPGNLNYAELLGTTLHPEHTRLLKTIAAEANRQEDAVYIVGGFVRDLLLDRPSLDFDMVVEGDAIALARAVARKHGGRVTTHRRFGTAKWHLPDPVSGLESIDLVTARTEFYTHPTALPTVERSSIKLDLHRRDFTLNTLALRLDGRHYGDLYDYWGGLSDLRQGLIRVLHSLSFVDDPTRMLRAVRFEQRFEFQIENRTLELLVAARGMLDRVSGDRLRHELEIILQEPNAAEMFARLSELDLLSAIHPDLHWDREAHGQMFHCPLPDSRWEIGKTFHNLPLNLALAYVVWFADLAPAAARRITRRLKVRHSLEKAVLDACRLREVLPGLVGRRPSEITETLDGFNLLSLYVVWCRLDETEQKEQITRYVEKWRHMRPETDGNRLRELGLPPGPVYKEILTSLRRAWLDGEIESVAEERAALEEWIEGA